MNRKMSAEPAQASREANSQSAPVKQNGIPGAVPTSVKDGRVLVERVGHRAATFSDLYHFLLVVSWSRLFLLFSAAYVGINVLFACAYLAGGDCIAEARPGSFHDAFFFSVQTMATIGYGRMYPKTTYADILVAAEAFCGLLGVSMATGLMFSKFAKPTARMIFTKNMVASNRDGIPCLMFRMANQRSNTIVEAQIQMVVSIGGRTAEGERVRRVLDLALTRTSTPVFTLTWTAIHPIDERSPLYGMSEEEIRTNELAFIITFTGIDDTFSQTVHARYAYGSKDILWGARFDDVLLPREGGGAVVDYTRFHDTVPWPLTMPKKA